MQIKISPILVEQEDENESLRSFLRIAHLLEETFPWPSGPFHAVTFSIEKERFWLTWLGSLAAEQVCWLQDSSLISRWSWSGGGFLSIENQAPTIGSHASTFFYEQEEEVMASLILSPSLGSHLHVQPSGDYIRIINDVQLQALLCDIGFPTLGGWTQRLRLCCRCDRPGASLISSLCMACEEAYKAFIQLSLPEFADDMKELLAERRLPLAFEPDDDAFEEWIRSVVQA